MPSSSLGSKPTSSSDGESPRAERNSLLSRDFTALLIAQASFGFAFSSFFLLPKFVNSQLGAGAFEIGLLTAVYGAVVIVFVPAMGALVDRHGRRNFLTAGALLMAAASFCFVYVDDMGPLLYALRGVQAVAFAMAFAAGAALAVDLAPPARMSQAIGVFGLTFLSMNAIAPAAVEEISKRADWPTAFAASATGAVLCALLSRRIPDSRPARGPSSEIANFWTVATRPRLLRMMAIIALVGTAMGAAFIYHQPYAAELGIENLKSFFIAYAAVAVFIRGAMGALADRVGLHRVSIAALALYVVVVTAMSALQPGWLPAYGAGLGLAHGFGYPALNAIAIRGVRENERGKVMSLFQAAFNVGFAGVSLALGWLAEREGYPPVFLVGGLSALFALVLLAGSPEGRPVAASGPREARP
jgi:predicted MFS family arabinose efflux permease